MVHDPGYRRAESAIIGRIVNEEKKPRKKHVKVIKEVKPRTPRTQVARY
ncbi:hypothetical protein [Weissella cibaria]|nr:hypothetical protein [Weissella cibaria]MCG4286493.1 hypothetical protein [Weissella cibaria]